MAERCADGAAAELLASPTALPAIEAHRDRVIETLREGMLKDAVPAFVRRYLVEKEGRYPWRPERAGKVEDIERRSKEIEREDDEP